MTVVYSEESVHAYESHLPVWFKDLLQQESIRLNRDIIVKSPVMPAQRAAATRDPIPQAYILPDQPEEEIKPLEVTTDSNVSGVPTNKPIIFYIPSMRLSTPIADMYLTLRSNRGVRSARVQGEPGHYVYTIYNWLDTLKPIAASACSYDIEYGHHPFVGFVQGGVYIAASPQRAAFRLLTASGRISTAADSLTFDKDLFEGLKDVFDEYCANTSLQVEPAPTPTAAQPIKPDQSKRPDFIKAWRTLALKGVKEKIRLSSETMKAREKELFQVQQQVGRAVEGHRDAIRQYHSFESMLSNPETADGEYVALSKLIPNMYQRIYFDNECIWGETQPTKVTRSDDPKKYWYLGRYRIGIRLADGIPRVFNMDSWQGRDGYVHPHSAGDTSVCLGNLSGTIPQLTKQGEYATALSLMHTWANTYVNADSYIKLENCATFKPGTTELLPVGTSGSTYDAAQESKKKSEVISAAGGNQPQPAEAASTPATTEAAAIETPSPLVIR